MGTFDSYETVQGLGIALRLGIPISVGATAKSISSHLADEVEGANPVESWALDMGLLVNPRLSSAPKLGFPAFVVTPSFALTARNLGPDVSYTDGDYADPIPTTYSAAYGLKLDAFDLADFEAGADMEHEWTRRSDSWVQKGNLGYSLSLLIFRISVGWLDDPYGGRYERHFSRSLDVNLLRLYRSVRRFVHWDFTSPSRAMESGYPFRAVRVLGMPFRANPHFEVGFREIDQGEIRQGQKSRYYFSLSL